MKSKNLLLKHISMMLFVLISIVGFSSCLKSDDNNYDELQEEFQNFINDRWVASINNQSGIPEEDIQWYIVFNKNANDYKYTFSTNPISEEVDLVMKALSIYDPYTGSLHISTLLKRGDTHPSIKSYRIRTYDNDKIELIGYNDLEGSPYTINLTREKVEVPKTLNGIWSRILQTNTTQTYQFKPNNELSITTQKEGEESKTETMGYKWKAETGVLEIFASSTIDLESKVVDYYIAKELVNDQLIFQAYDSQFTLTRNN